MNGQSILDKIIDTYRPNFDVEEPYEYHGEVYDAYAGFSMTSAKYVLVKRAELWRAHCFEHAFFQCRDVIHAGDILRFQKQLLEYMEPELVRGGEPEPVKDHMYTYLTGVFVSEKAVSPETVQVLKKLIYSCCNTYKNEFYRYFNAKDWRKILCFHGRSGQSSLPFLSRSELPW